MKFSKTFNQITISRATQHFPPGFAVTNQKCELLLCVNIQENPKYIRFSPRFVKAKLIFVVFVFMKCL